MRVDWSNKVVRDFRQRILVDPNNPILAFKASRDRYTLRRGQEKYAGLPHLGSVNSEDALTWNVFRSLQKAQRLDLVVEWLQIDMGRPTAMLIWCLDPELTDAAGDLQFQLGDLLRSADGVILGQISEPDIVIQGTEGIAVVECKLGEPNKPLPHLWEGSSLQRVKKRLDRYQQDVPRLLKDNKTEVDVMPVYQLVRMAYYAIKLGQSYQLQPMVVSVGNEFNWPVEICKSGKSAADLWDAFCDLLGPVQLHCKSTTWQALMSITENKEVGQLYRYLTEHPCLRCSSE